MSRESLRIRLRIGANEIEIEAPFGTVQEAIDLIPKMVERLPSFGRSEVAELQSLSSERSLPANSAKSILPEIRVEKDDSLTDVITKIFRDRWGRHPRKLSEIREALESYGLIYPKQSVAVALLRLAQSGKLRRFKGEDGGFIYTASTGLTTNVGSPLMAEVGS